MSHSRLSPSKSSRVLACAASVNREAAFPDDGGSAPANEGTNAHWLLEQGLAEGVWPPAIAAFGPEKLQAALPYPDFDLPDELIQQAKDCFEYVQRRVIEMKPANARVEVQVDPQLYTGRDDSSGKADVLIVSDQMLEVVDLKTGGKLVEPDGSQFKLYGLGSMAQYADKNSGLAPFPTVRLTAFQPKRPGVDTIERSVDFTQAELIDWATDVWAPAAAKSDDPAAEATPSEEACRYCKAQKNRACPEYTAAVSGAAATLFKPVDQNGFDPVAHPIADPMMSEFAVDALTPDQMGLFLEIWPLLKARGKDIEDRAVELLKERTAIPGFKLVKGSGRRGWSIEDPEALEKKFKNLKLTLPQIFDKKIRSPANMLNQELTTKRKESIKRLVVTKEGALTLVPSSDKRVDALPSVDFKPVEAQEVVETTVPNFLSI